MKDLNNTEEAVFSEVDPDVFVITFIDSEKKWDLNIPTKHLRKISENLMKYLNDNGMESYITESE